MHFTFQIEVDVERTEGKFAARDDIAEAISTELDTAMGSVDLSGLGSDGTSEYEMTDYVVEEVPQPKRARRRR